MDPQQLIDQLDLRPLTVEGGYFRETYRSQELIRRRSLPDRYGADRAYCTAIYYLLTPDTFSAIHRVKSDEIFHFYLGDPVEMVMLHPDGTSSMVQIGQDISAGQQPQVIVPNGIWQGCRLVPGGRLALMGTTVAPGFDYDDYEHGDRNELLSLYPDRAEIIRELTRA